VTAFGVASQAVQAVRFFDSVATQAAVEGLHASTLEVKSGLRGGELLQRSCFAAFRNALLSACAKKQNRALMVYGPRGVGKSTMVAAALQVVTILLLYKLLTLAAHCSDSQARESSCTRATCNGGKWLLRPCLSSHSVRYGLAFAAFVSCMSWPNLVVFVMIFDVTIHASPNRTCLEYSI
jgi:hypothetical protein